MADSPKLQTMRQVSRYCPDQSVGGGAVLLSQRKGEVHGYVAVCLLHNLRWSLKHWPWNDLTLPPSLRIAPPVEFIIDETTSLSQHPSWWCENDQDCLAWITVASRAQASVL